MTQTLIFNCDLTVLAKKVRRDQKEPIQLKAGRPYKVSEVKFSSNQVAFTLSRGERVEKLPTKYLQR